jgi:hypothetical protein
MKFLLSFHIYRANTTSMLAALRPCALRSFSDRPGWGNFVDIAQSSSR